jgi:hypothetical protein
MRAIIDGVGHVIGEDDSDFYCCVCGEDHNKPDNRLSCFSYSRSGGSYYVHANCKDDKGFVATFDYL